MTGGTLRRRFWIEVISTVSASIMLALTVAMPQLIET